MSTEKQPSFLSHFEQLEDPRIDRKKLYPLVEILFLVLCASICGAQSWRDYVTFGEEKLSYLRRFLAFEHGIPSKTTIARVMSSLDPRDFKQCFIAWIQSFQLTLKEVIAIDGKTLRRSFDKALAHSAIHMVSAFATSARLVLGQQKVAHKSNEISAIPKLLDLLALEGSIVSIDAMGTQKTIAKKIRQKQADYVLALKANHCDLHEDIKLFLSHEIEKLKANKAHKIVDYDVTYDKGHGRIVKRTCYVSDHINWLTQRAQWSDLRTIAMIESEVIQGKQTSTQKRYFISSLAPKASELAASIRSHWAIENTLHWILDVSLGEDNSRVRKDHAPENMAMVRHVTLNLLQNAKKKFKDMSIKRLQKKAGWGNSTLDLVLMQKF